MTPDIRVLSLWQPFATLWCTGAKVSETRSWRVPFTGLVAVHAARKWNDASEALCESHPFRTLLGDRRGHLARGAIVGLVELSGCRYMTPEVISATPDIERCLGEWQVGRWAWDTTPRRLELAEPIEFLGAQGFRKLAPAIAEQLYEKWRQHEQG